MYPQSGWKVTYVREIRKGKKKLMTLTLSHLGIFHVVVHRDFPLDRVKRVVVKLTKSEKVHVTFIVEDVTIPSLPKTGKVVALDVGVEKLLVTSDGEYVPNTRPYEKALWRVKHLRKGLSRKKFLSHNLFLAKVKVARAYEHVRQLRRDLYMKLGKYLATHYDMVVMEDIHVKQMVGKSLRKTRASLHDVAFHELRTVVHYQLQKYGKSLTLVDPAYTSRTCANCGYVKEDLTLQDRVFSCQRCGWVAGRDYNASLNILRRSGSERPAGPVEFRPLPFVGKVGGVNQEAPP
ncbi:hypothetical protein IC007_0070 [Sulfuracidifex tepidarius]|uniref:Transposase n=1 Tax=Sulfuracidifex tepidarius TaxID=1294262 RepID=A0A510DZ98_9CREN|nr:hypothetical protein IC007_0070 [Sulfuracidifex tepidarius]